MFFSRLNLRIKALIAPVLFLIAGADLTVSAVQSYSVQMMEQRKDTLRSVIEAVQATAAHFADEEAAGRMTREAAMLASRDVISRVRFGRGDYIVVFGPDATVLVHSDTKLVDQANQDLPPKMALLVRQAVEQVQQKGPVFSKIHVTRPGNTALVPKLSYNTLLGEWNWIVGAGLYVDDIEADVWSYGEKLSAITMVAVGIAGLVSWIAMAEFNGAMRRVMGSMRSLAGGDTNITVPDRTRHDEVGTVANTLET